MRLKMRKGNNSASFCKIISGLMLFLCCPKLKHHRRESYNNKNTNDNTFSFTDKWYNNDDIHN